MDHLRTSALLAVLFLSGCVPDLSAWRIVPSTDPESDGGLPPPVGGPCPLPTLLVATENFDAEGGLVMRFHLESDRATRCTDLSGGGAIVGQPRAVVANAGTVVVATAQSFHGIDVATDTVRWSEYLTSTTWLPNDAFLLRDRDTGDELYALAWGDIGTCSTGRCPIRHVVAHDAAGVERAVWTVGGDPLPTTSSTSMTRDPFDPERVLVMHATDYAAREATLYPPAALDGNTYALAPAGAYLRTLATHVTATDALRSAWTGSSGDVEGLFYLDDPAPTTGQTPSFATVCGGCELAHVVPDPARPTGYVGLCVIDGVRRDLVRFSVGACDDVLVSGDALGDRRRMSYLSIED